MDGGTSVKGVVLVEVVGRPAGRVQTGSKSSLVYPSMHVGALILQLSQLVLRIFELVLQILDLILEGSDGIVERLGQWIWRGFHVGGNWPM